MGHSFLIDSEGGEQSNLKLLCPEMCVGALLHDNQEVYSKAAALAYNLCRYQVILSLQSVRKSSVYNLSKYFGFILICNTICRYYIFVYISYDSMFTTWTFIWMLCQAY